MILRITLAICLLMSSTFTYAIEPMSRAEYEGRGGEVDSDSGLYDNFLYAASAFLADHFRWPNAEEADAILNQVKEKQLSRVKDEDAYEELAAKLENETVASVLKESKAGVMQDLKSKFTKRYMFIRRKIAVAYSRAIRQTDLPARYRVVARTPSLQLVFLASIKAKSNGGPKLLDDYLKGQLSIENMEDLIVPGRASVERTGPFPQPLIFENGRSELEEATRFDAPFAFRNYINTDIVNTKRGQATLEAIKKAKGFVAVSWTSGKKDIPQDYWESLIAMLEERDWIAVVCPTQQNFEGLPEQLLNNPRIHLLTNTIENRYLKLSNMPLNPNVKEPLTLVKQVGGYRSGQTVIVFHPHQTMETVATTTNEFLPVQLWSTGSLNEPFGPFTGVSQGARAEANKAFHKTKFLVVEKGDGVSRFDSDPLQNIWHVRPVTYYDDRQYNGTAGFIDFSHTYQFKYSQDGTRQFQRFDENPQFYYLGDPHDRITDPRFAKSMVDDLPLSPETRTTFIAGDWFDGGSIIHWLDGKMAALNLKFQAGGMNLQQEINQFITSINALLQRYPNARFAQIVGNHDEWLTRLLEKSPDVQDVINGDFLVELRFAVQTLRMNAWEYILLRRQDVMGSILAAHPDKRREILGRVLPVFDPNRIDIIGRDQKLYAGPAWRPVALNFHGDKGAGPKGGSFKDSAKAMPEGGGVLGHSHKPKAYSEMIDVGLSADVEQDYTVGSYAAQAQGIAPIYTNGTKQLYIFNRMAGTFRQRYPNKVPAAKIFFGEDRLKLVENDNDLVDQSKGENEILAELGRLKKMMSCQKALVK